MLKISFFSYKGGAGRSSIAYNTIPIIAKKIHATAANPMIVVDMDIDSAGMTFLLNNESDEYECDTKYYMTHELLAGQIPGVRDDPDEVPLSEHALFSHLFPAGNEFGLEDDYSILFIGAKPGAGIEGKDAYDRAGNPIMRLYKLCKSYGCSALIFDTPTGDQLTAKWSMAASTDIVCCMRITKQFTIGTINYLVRKDSEYEGKTYYLVPNAVPNDSIYVDNEVYNIETTKKRLLTALDKKKSMIKNNTIDLSMVDGETFGIPEVKRFKIKEGILFKLGELQEDEKEALKCYEHLAEILISR